MCLRPVPHPAFVPSVLALALLLGACSEIPITRPGPNLSPSVQRPVQQATDQPRPVAPEPSVEVHPENLPPAPPGQPGGRKVALLLPLSGAAAATGQAMLNAAQLALFETGDDQFTLLPEDTGDTPDGAVRAAQSAIAGGAGLILGPLFAASVRAVAPIAQGAGINIVAFSNDQSVAGSGVYLLGLRPEQQVARVIGAAREKGLSRFAALIPEDAYGHAVADALTAAVAKPGPGPAASVVLVVTYDPQGEVTETIKRLANYEARHAALVAERRSLAGKNDPDSTAQLKRLQNMDTLGDLPFDALLIPKGGAKLRSIAALLPYYDIDPAQVKMLGGAEWGDPALANEPALRGGWFAGPDPALRDAFAARYRDAFGRPPPQIADLAYDATALAALLARAQNGPNFSTAALTDGNGFAGIDGIFRLLPGGLSERGYAVLEMQPRNFTVISPAPQTFQALSQ